MIPPVVPFDSLEQLRSSGRRVVIADVRWYLDGRNGREAYESAHLPDAVWVDLEGQLSAHGRTATEGRHPFPFPADFAAAMGSLGIDDDTIVLAYDDTGGLTAGRMVVMLRMLGRDAALLDGGLPVWVAEGRPVQTGPGRSPTAANFTATGWPMDRLVDAATAVRHATTGGALIDARPRERFTGELVAVDPRPGHIPGARSAPWSAVLGADGRFLAADELRAHFGRLGATTATAHSGTIAYCGSGVSACMNVIAMEAAGFDPPQLFVASFSGWSSDLTRAVEVGE